MALKLIPLTVEEVICWVGSMNKVRGSNQYNKEAMIEAADRMEAAANTISHECNWTKHASARKSCGQTVCVYSDDATKFCISGALVLKFHPGLMGYSLPLEFASSVLDRLACKNGFSDMVSFNDNHMTVHSEVIEFYNLAIEVTRAAAIEIGKGSGVDDANSPPCVGAD